jgi:MFS family permease
MKLELRLLLLSNYLNFFGYGLFAPLFAVYVTSIGGSVFHAGAAFGVYSLTAGLVTFLFGRLEDHEFDKRKMVCLGYFLLAVGVLGYYFVTEMWHLFVVQVFNATAYGIFNPGFKTLYAEDEDVGKEAEQWALVDGGDMILLSIAAIIGGLYVDRYGFRSLFLIMAAMQFIAFLCCSRILFHKKKVRVRKKKKK